MSLAVGAAHAQEALHFEHLTVDDGLTDNQINDIVQDRSGFIWIATGNGLNRFDGQDVRRFLHDSRVAGGLPHNNVRALEIDERGRLWVGTRGGGLARYDDVTERFTVFRENPDDPGALPSDFVSTLAADGHGGLWVGTRVGGLSLLNFDSERFEHARRDPIAAGALRSADIGTVALTDDGTLWVGGVGHGLYRYDGRERGFRQFLPIADDPTSLPSTRVQAIREDGRGRLWIATSAGLALWQPQTQSFRRWQHDGREQSLAGNDVRDVLEANDGALWLSIGGIGLQLFDPERGNLMLQRQQPTRRNSLADLNTTRMFVDRAGVLWIGSSLGVDRLDPATRAFTAYAADVGHPERFADDNLWGIDRTSDGVVWLATATKGVVRFDPRSGNWSNFRHDANDANSLASDTIYSLMVDSKDQVWVGTADAGLDRYDAVRNRWLHHRNDPDDDQSILHDRIYAISEARDGGLWIGLNSGFDRMDPATGRFTRPAWVVGESKDIMETTVFDIAEDRLGTVWIATFMRGVYSFRPQTRAWQNFSPERGNPEGLASFRVNALLTDSKGRVWAGTDLGVFLHLGDGNRWRGYAREQGPSTASISSLLEDRRGQIWVGTTNGLNRLDPISGKIDNYHPADGLPHSEIGWHGLAETADGHIAIATSGGFALFDPSAARGHRVAPQVALTSLELFNRRVPLAHELNAPLAGDEIALTHSIAHTDAITLNHRQNVLSIGFAGLHHARPRAMRYQYRLDGWDADWLDTTAQRRIATYTNLPGGTYTFRARAATHDGLWSQPTPGLRLIVKPPPWKSPLAYALYALAIALIVGFGVRHLLRRADVQRARAEREAEINERLRRVDQLRDEFLANTSHELRTPLHGIIGIAESLSDGAAGPMGDVARQNLGLIVASGRRLSSLVNDILDFSTLRNDSLTLSRKPIDLRPLVDIVLMLSRPLLSGKPVQLVNRIAHDLPAANADEARVQQILHNLIGNAIKFTAHGEVAVDAEVAGDLLVVAVRDTGIGIAETDQQRIFESFQQAQGDATREYGGTGLGLSIARQLVQLHGGTLSVESTVGRGSTFRFTLPISGEVMPRSDVETRVLSDVATPAAPSTPSRIATMAADDAATSPFRVLVVDDDPINRQVLVNQLSLHHYRVIEAADGEEALRMVASEQPDLVLLDVMMPRMSGYDVCRLLRETQSATQMPVIYLTARSQVVDVVTGFESGANDFLSKPVARSELLARVRTQLELLDATRNLERKVSERTEALRLANEELGRLASLDGLTRIPNRRSLDTALARQWDEHARSGEQLALLIFDIDHFKRFNDHYGHQGGDEALIAVAQTAAATLRRPGDLIARYGGEEFVVLLPRTDLAGAAAIAEQIVTAIRTLARPHAASDTAAIVTISIGAAALVPNPALPAGTLLEHADRALYVAKRSGRNRVALDQDQDQS